MKKKRITYGVYGMMEYQSIIKIGRATLKIMFTDGSMTAFGQNPAKYTTTNFLVQRAIENSSEFKKGRITVVNAIELDEEVRIERNPTKVEEPQDTADDTTKENVIDDAPKENTTADDKTEVEFSDNQEAKDYIFKNFGVKPSTMRNRDDIKTVGLTYGVTITFANENKDE